MNEKEKTLELLEGLKKLGGDEEAIERLKEACKKDKVELELDSLLIKLVKRMFITKKDKAGIMTSMDKKKLAMRITLDDLLKLLSEVV